MKLLPFLPFLLAGCTWAQVPADLTAIRSAIAGLNRIPPPHGLFTADADITALDDLWKEYRVHYGVVSRANDPRTPTVTISHEPWGEATINFPGMPSAIALEIVNPRIESRSIRFMTSELALADGVCIDRESSPLRTTHLFFVLKKETGVWKIASVRREKIGPDPR